MIATKIIWPVKYNWPQAAELGEEYTVKMEGLPDVAKNIAPDFDSKLTLFIENNDGRRTSYRTWPTEESAQLWIDYMVANFDGILATIVNQIEVPENSVDWTSPNA
jgi:hypothetical protein